MDPALNSAPPNRHIEQSTRLTDGKLVNGEVTGGEVTGIVFPTLLRTYWYPRLARRINGATSPTSMVT